MRARVKYDTKFGFQFTNSTDVPRALSIIQNALGEDVEIASSCFLCGETFEEKDAELQGRVLCSGCLQKEDAYSLYAMRFAKLMEEV